MHELGILRYMIKLVSRTARENGIQKVKHITLQVGKASGVVPQYLRKLYPLAIDSMPAFKDAELRICLSEGQGVIIKDIGYE